MTETKAFKLLSGTNHTARASFGEEQSFKKARL
jgi:hypothetical protein